MPTGIYPRTKDHLKKLQKGLRKFHADPEKSKLRAEKISKALMGNTNSKGQISWIKGKYHSEKTKNKMREAHLGNQNHKWKGDKVGYRALHNWIETHKSKPKICEFCKKKKRLTLANISGEYKRKINDYKWLCYKCHKNYDIRRKKLEQ